MSYRIGILIVALGIMLAGCNAPTATPTPAPTPRRTPLIIQTPTPEVIIVPSPATSPKAIYTEKVNLDAFAPPGEGRDLLIMNCGYCHAFVCAVRGQRTQGHWNLVETTHLGRGWVLLPEKDWNTLFAYLRENFNDQKPEPQLPPIFQQVGCTHSSLR